MKTFDKKDVYSWSNCEEARQYIGDEGYFCDTYHENLAAWHRGILQDVDQSLPVDCIFENEKNEVFGLFLPACKVKQARSPHWRPFKNCKELCQYIRVTGEDLYVGLTLNIRNKENKTVRQVLVTEINYDKPLIGLGISLFDLENLYRSYEWQDEDNGEWQPFGVEE